MEKGVYMSAAKKFLDDFQERPLSPLESGLKSSKLILGENKNQLEVAVLTSDRCPNNQTIQRAQKKRKSNRAAPVLLTVIHENGDQADVCGPSGDKPPVHKNIRLDIVEKFCRTALKQPDKNKVIKFCSHFLPSLENGLFGINNRGMLSSHHLVHGVKQRLDWEDAKPNHGKYTLTKEKSF